MTKLSELIKVFKRNYSDVLGVDVGSSATKVVRIKRINGNPTLVAADILPAIVLSSQGAVPSFSSQLPKGLKSRYVALATSGSGSIIKLLTFPPHIEKSMDDQVGELMGLGNNSDFRVAYELIQETRAESRVLAVGLPNPIAHALSGLFPEGVPAPCSIEVSGLASLTAYQRGPGTLHTDDCVAMIDFGAAVTLVSFFFKGSLVLIRKFDFGAVNILKKLQDNLGVDQDVAAGILNDGSFDVSRIMHQAMEHFLQQLTIAWDYVERRENTRIAKLYATGGGVSLRLWRQEVETTTGQLPVIWNPFEALVIQAGAFPDRLKGQEGRFSAAVGAVLGMLRQ
ncbi:MAG: pilus assembly protein PilM [bacterium]